MLLLAPFGRLNSKLLSFPLGNASRANITWKNVTIHFSKHRLGSLFEGIDVAVWLVALTVSQ